MKITRGFTLLEMLIALTVMAVLLSISLPDFTNFIQNKKSDDTINRVEQAVNTAKTSAIVNSSFVTLCKSSDGETCGGSWEQGIIAFTDDNGDRQINQDDKLIRYFSFPEAEGSIHWRAFRNRQYLQITGQGFTRYQNGNFTYCPYNKKADLARQVIINRTARVRHAIDSDGDGIREDSRGKPIRC